MTDLEWTLDEAPPDGEPAQQAGRGGTDLVPLPARRRAPRWLVPALLAGLALAAAAAYAYTRIGWQRIEAQITAEVSYEDAQARAGNMAAVGALQADDDLNWLRLRQAEAALGWPAAQPAIGLYPADDPPRVLAVELKDDGVYEAAVLRYWVDADGQRYGFVLAQRYRGAGAGLWERLPPEWAQAQDTETWLGQRLTARFPAGDADWLNANLPAVDAALVEACAQWNCPDDLRILYSFAANPAVEPLPNWHANARPEAPAPLTFLLPTLPQASGPRGRAVAAKPVGLAGAPHDEAASRARVRALTAAGLHSAALSVARTLNSRVAYLVDALAAREEIRQGLSPAPAGALNPAMYEPPNNFWAGGIGPRTDHILDLPYRLTALHFVDFLMAERPDVGAAQLLASLAGPQSARAWPFNTYGAAGPALLGHYTAAVQAEFARYEALPWSELDGLLYECGGETLLVQGGQPRHLTSARLPWAAWSRVGGRALSPDGRWLAIGQPPGEAQSMLYLLDLRDDSLLPLRTSGDLAVMGWSAAGHLVYAEAAQSGEPAFEARYRMMAYNPVDRQHRVLTEEAYVPMWWLHPPQWSADRSLLAVTTAPPDLDPVYGMAPAVIAPDSAVVHSRLVRLGAQGHSAAIAPNGQSAVYVAFTANSESPMGLDSRLAQVDLATLAETTFLAAEDLGPNWTPPLHMQSLIWSASGEFLAFVAQDDNSRQAVVVMPAGGGQPRLLYTGMTFQGLVIAGFSADGRYLAYMQTAEHGHGLLLTALDLDSGDRRYFSLPSGRAIWSPSGSKLVVSNDWGLYVVDVGTGALRWVGGEGCRELGWW